MLLGIEYFKGDTLLYGKKVSRQELRNQINEIENSYDRIEDNFVEFLCRRFGWTILDTNDIPEFVYDRDVEYLYEVKGIVT